MLFRSGVPPLLAWTVLRSRREGGIGPRDALRRGGAFAAGLVPGMTLGFVDLTGHSGQYYDDQAHNVRLLILAVAGSLIGGIAETQELLDFWALISVIILSERVAMLSGWIT